MSAADCQQECVKDDDCKFWTWNSPDFTKKNTVINPDGGDVTNRCFLQGSGIKEVLGKVSGPKKCQDAGRLISSLSYRYMQSLL